jgi:hypothetical protein
LSPFFCLVSDADASRTPCSVPLDRESLAFDIALDGDPQVTGLDVEELEVEGAAKLPGGDILVHVSVAVQVELDLLIDGSEYYTRKERGDDRRLEAGGAADGAAPVRRDARAAAPAPPGERLGDREINGDPVAREPAAGLRVGEVEVKSARGSSPRR